MERSLREKRNLGIRTLSGKNYLPPYQGIKSLSGYGSSYNQAPAQTVNSYGNSYQQQVPVNIPTQSSGGYGQSVVTPTQSSGGYGQQQVLAQSSNSYGNSVVTPVITPTQSSGTYGQSYEQPAPAPAILAQSSNSYGQSVVAPTQSSSSYSQSYQQPAPAIEVQPSNSYGQSYQQPAPAFVAQSSNSYGQSVVAPTQSSGAYGQSYQQAAPTVSPMQSYYSSQPAIQQLITQMVNQYHGNQLALAQEPPNTCSIGYVQAIYEGEQISETYCRCPTGTYGFTCTENFLNPCLDGATQYSPADSRVPPNYFIKCSWGIPYLNKCPAGTTQWSQELYTCVADGSSYGSSYGSSNYGSSSYGY